MQDIEKRTEILEEISRKNDIRATRPEYRIILDSLQLTSPTTVKDLTSNINTTYGFEFFSYKQIYDIIDALIKINVVFMDEKKQISINKEYIVLPHLLPLSSYVVYLLTISVMVMFASLVMKFMVDVTIIVFLTGIMYVLAQRFGSEFEFKKFKK